MDKQKKPPAGWLRSLGRLLPISRKKASAIYRRFVLRFQFSGGPVEYSHYKEKLPVCQKKVVC
jgi:hypothetical protein